MSAYVCSICQRVGDGGMYRVSEALNADEGGYE